MKQTWALQDAKAKLCDLVSKAENGSIQVISKHGHDAVVVMSCAQYETLLGSEKSAWDSMHAYSDPKTSRVEIDKLFQRKKSNWRRL